MSVRLASLTALLAIERGQTTLATEVDRGRADLTDERDRALLVELTTGTLRWRAQLDALLGPCSARPLDSLTPGVRAILRLSAYQLEHLDRIPPHAVLHEAVELTRTIGEPRAAGFVNAVLRTLRRTRSRLTLPQRPQPGAGRRDALAYLSTSLSHPEWLVSRWVDRHGFDATEQWCRFNNTTPEVTIRSLRALTQGELLHLLRDAKAAADPARFVADAVTLQPGTFGHLPAEVSDQLLVQDEVSQIVAHAVAPEAGDRVLDLCAAPGAKTVVLSADLQGRGLLVSCDHRPGRVRLLRRTLRRAALHASVVTLDATRTLPFGPVFDRVFVDVPCSGLGVLRRDPDLKWSRQPDDLTALAGIQRRILTRAADAVAPGGRLIYATCSSEPEENDLVVEAFVADDARFERAPVAFGPMIVNGTSLIDANGYLRTWPFRDGLDAFFAALLVRH
jgi:16S rRNA (cytosine967-C5)-methyltransferase